jgi:hypothetical protein
VAIAAALALAGLTALGLAGIGGDALARLGGLGGRAAAQPDRGAGPTLPGETVTPLPGQMPGERPERWSMPQAPILRPELEVDGTLASVGGTQVVLAPEAPPGLPAAPEVPPTAVDLADDTTYYVEGRPTTADQLPEGAPARVTYELRGARRVARRVEVDAPPAPILPAPVP